MDVEKSYGVTNHARLRQCSVTLTPVIHQKLFLVKSKRRDFSGAAAQSCRWFCKSQTATEMLMCYFSFQFNLYTLVTQESRGLFHSSDEMLILPRVPSASYHCLCH